MKALEKDRSRRYETASSFAADVQHYLNDEAVVACPPSAGYKFKTFARRNRAALTLAGLGATAFIAVCIALVVGYRSRYEALQARTELERSEAARLEEQTAREQAERARENARLDVLVEEGLRLASGNRHNIAAAIENFSTVLAKRPNDVSVHLYRGSAFHRHGQLEAAEKDLSRALELQPEDNIAAHEMLAVIKQSQGTGRGSPGAPQTGRSRQSGIPGSL